MPDAQIIGNFQSPMVEPVGSHCPNQLLWISVAISAVLLHSQLKGSPIPK